MAAHKNRTGQLIVSWHCKTGNCDACDPELGELGGVIVCHHSCHADDGCVPTIRRKPQRRRICTSCNLDHPEGTEC